MVRHAVVLACLLAGVAPAAAQRTRWVVEPQASLAWWQINPHYGHLWATTCPADPSWQAGESRDGDAPVHVETRKATLLTDYLDDRVPLYPRGEVSGVCRPAVRGVITAEDASSWRNLRGTISVMPDSLITGMKMRDEYARKAVFETTKYPEIRFNIDSIGDFQPGDTIQATAYGSLDLHGVTTPHQAPIRAWREAGGNLRVLADLTLPASDLTKVYGMSRWALGMGVLAGRWRAVHAGVDLMMREVGAADE